MRQYLKLKKLAQPILSSLLQYSCAVLMIGLVFYLRMKTQSILGEDAALLPFLLAVILMAWIGTTGVGIFTAIIGSGTGVYFFIEPYNSVNATATSDVIRVVLFLLEGVSLSLIIGSLKNTKKQLQTNSVELIEARNRADISNASKSLFLANMSHEIRTPMTAILGFTELMLSENLAENTKSEFLKSIQKNTKSLCRLIDDILDLSKVEAGKLQIESVTFSPSKIIAETITLLQLRAKDKGIQLNYKESELPALASSDPMRIRQILINIISNAIKFTPQGSVNVHSTFELKTKTVGTLRIAVEDTGVGISPEKAVHLFQPFTQADSSMTRKFGGTGLGLFLSRQLAQKLDGNITLESSTEGKGSRFLISFTLKLAHTTVESGADISVKDRKLLHLDLYRNLKNKKILLAEDSSDNQILFSFFLKAYGLDVEIANNGKEAVQKALQHPHDLILMDIQMPEMNGYEALSALRERGYNGKILALTAHSMIEEQQHCLNMGFNGFLSKPISRDLLIETIGDAILPTH
jgi:two-component system, sensor histidine kinase